MTASIASPIVVARKSLLPVLFAAMCSLASAELIRAAVPTVSFATTRATAREAGLVPATLELRRSSTDGPLTVHYTTDALSLFELTRPFEPYPRAIANKDFQPLSGQVTFAPGQATAQITFQPLPHYHFNPYRIDRPLTLTLTASPAYTLGPAASATITTLDDPSPKRIDPDPLFFSKLDLARPGLESVRAAVAKDDYPAARSALAAYLRARTSPSRKFAPRTPNLTTVNNALKSTYSVSGITHQFKDGRVDWSARDVKDPKSGIHNPNWCWEFNRFQWWPHLIAHYLQDPTANRASGQRLAHEMRDWIDTSPLELQSKGLTPGIRWRALEVGSRLDNTWIAAFLQLKHADIFSDDLLVDLYKTFYLHARYLEVSSEVSTNRGAGEARALFVAGSMFPEFTESADWTKLGLQRLNTILDNDVFPDGVYNEMSPGYLDISIPAFEHTLEDALRAGIPLPPSFTTKIEQMYDYLLYASEPNRFAPSLNDSHTLYAPLDKRLAIATRLFPNRKDYLWFTTDGAQGTPPPQTSRLFPDAGQVILRSGWSRSDNYLLMDAGPFGVGGHGNEDKLSISVDGYGVRHLIDCGPYDYVNTSPYRIYSVSTLGKSAPIIDGLSQNRNGVKPLELAKSPVTFLTSPEFDYTSASYGVNPLEGWGPDRLRPAETTRHIFFLKPDVWVLIDTFKALDSAEHTYSTLFQCNDDQVVVDPETRRVTIQLLAGEFDPFTRTTPKTDQPSLTITRLTPAPLTVRRGAESPDIAGWRFEKSSSWKLQPIPTARYDFRTSGNAQLAYVLAAAPAGTAPRQPIITPLATDPGTYGLSVRTDPTAPPITLLIALDGKTLTWKGTTHTAPALILSGDQIHPWPSTPAR